MSLKYKCENCGKEIITKFLKVGETAKCRFCGAETVVPESGTETAAESTLVKEAKSRTKYQISSQEKGVALPIQKDIVMAPKVRTVIGVLLALFVGVVAFPFVFSDLGPGETVVRRVAVVGGIYFAGGVLSGAVAFRRWPVSGLCAWTAFLMGFFMLIALIVALIGGFVGYCLTKYQELKRTDTNKL